MNKMDYFFDSYAIIELINQNKSYLHYQDSVIITNSLNLAEVHYFLLKNYDEQTADYWISNLDFSILEITSESSIKASKLKYKYRKQKLSYADCIGYVMAQDYGLKFLTGDKEFENFVGVEFVK